MRWLKWTGALAALALASVAVMRWTDERPSDAKAAPAVAMMAMPVPVVPVVTQTLPIYLRYPGRIEAIRGISLQARVSGYVDAQLANDGADVKQGDLLYKIDPRDLQAALDQARAAAQRDAASLEYARGQSLARPGIAEERLCRQGHVRPAVRARCGSGEAALVADQAAH